MRTLAVPLAATLALALAVATPSRAEESRRKYNVLRAEEDWSWLESAPPAAADDFDCVKDAKLSERWRFLLGGSTRLRMESDSNKTLGASPVEDDTFERYRAFLHFQF